MKVNDHRRKKNKSFSFNLEFFESRGEEEKKVPEALLKFLIFVRPNLIAKTQGLRDDLIKPIMNRFSPEA